MSDTPARIMGRDDEGGTGTAMLAVREVTKRFGLVEAVAGITFAVGDGEIVGFLGPNGAGKTTTMRMLAGIFPPTSGTLQVAGHDPLREPLACRRAVGYFPEHAPYYPELTVGGYLRLRREAEAAAAPGPYRCRRPCPGGMRPRGRGTPAGGRAVEGIPPARRPCPGIVRRSADPHPGRAHHRTRPGTGGRDPPAGAGTAGPAHGAVLEPHPLRGGGGMRSGGGDRPGPHRGGGNAGGAGGAARARTPRGRVPNLVRPTADRRPAT